MKVTPRQLQCHGMFAVIGYPLSGACAIVGNLVRESGEDLPSRFRSGKLDHGSQGLPQWRLGRLANYLAFVRRSVAAHGGTFEQVRDSMQMQVDFIDEELRTDYPLLRAKLMKGGDVSALTADFCWQFERPSKALSGIQTRIDAAKALAVAVGAKPDTVVDHLQLATAKQVTAQKGGTVVAAGGLVAAIGGAVWPTLGGMPAWEIGLIGLGLTGAVAGLVGSVAAGHKASDLRTAISGVTPDAPAEEHVEHAEVTPPVEAEPAPASATVAPLTDADVARIVQIEIAKALVQMRPDLDPPPAVSEDPLHPSNAGQAQPAIALKPWVAEAKADAPSSALRDRLASGAAMGIVKPDGTPAIQEQQS